MHDPATQLAALDALQRMEDAGEPLDFEAVAKTVGTTGRTCRRWWAKRDHVRERAGGTPRRTAERDPNAEVTMQEALAWVEDHIGDGLDPRTARNLADLYRERENARGVARGNLSWQLHKQCQAVIDALDADTPTGALTPEEHIEEMLETPRLLLEAFLRCPELHSRPEVLRVVQAAA